MGELVTDGYCILGEPARAIKIHGPVGTRTEVARFAAMVHAVKITAGSVETGTLPYAVTTACGRQMPRSGVQQDRSWEVAPEDASPLCEVCKEATTRRRR